jgi:CSLREA domain-containing protein
MGTWPACADPCAAKPSCDDGNACTADACDKAKGCVHATTVPLCEDGDPCTQGDACQAGACTAGAKVCDLGVNSADDVGDGACDAKHCSLRDAIVAANASGKPASIGFAALGPIALAAALPSSAVALTVVAADASVTIDGGGAWRIFHAKADLELGNLVLKGGAGGAIGGGAVWQQAGTLTMTQVQVLGATSAGSGGAVRASGPAVLDRCAFGGHKLSAASATGAALHVEGAGTIRRSVFADNVALGAGGAVSCGTGCTLLVERSGFVGNGAERGGALYVQGKATVVHTTLVANSAKVTGGAIDAPGALEAIHVTVTGNSAPNVAGIGAGGTLALRNSVLGESLGGGADCAAGKLLATVANLVGDGGCNAKWQGPLALGPVTAGCDLLPQRLPLAGSAARDAGDAGVCGAAPAGGVDQCGVTRPQGAGCELGAVEVVGG